MWPGTLQRQRRPGNEVVDDALAWIDHNAERPFFTWVHLYDAHRPYYVPDAQTTRYGDPYLDTIAFQDSQIARIVAALESRRLLDKTIVVVAADHGESLGEHGEDGHGIFLYESTLRVPLIMRVPDFRPRRVTSTVRLVDLMPTLLDLLHVPVTTADGVSLARLMRPDGTDIQLEAYSESTYPERFGWSRLRSLRGDRYKLIEAPRPELYDLQTDPFEQRNLYAENPRLAGLMRERIKQFEAPAPEPPPLQRRRGRGPCQPPGGTGLCRHIHAFTDSPCGRVVAGPEGHYSGVQRNCSGTSGALSSRPAYRRLPGRLASVDVLTCAKAMQLEDAQAR